MIQTSNNGSKFVHTKNEIFLNNLYQSTCPDKTLMNMLIKSFNAYDPDYYKDGHRHKEIKRRATNIVKIVLYIKMKYGVWMVGSGMIVRLD